MKVCHLGKYYPPAPGGIETHVRVLARAQGDLPGIETRVFCVNHEAGPTVVEHDGPVEVTRFGRLGSAGKFDICPDLAGALKRVETDVFHLQAPNPVMSLALLRVRPKVPVVVTYQSDLIRQRILRKFFLPLEHLLYRRQVRAILATSPTYPSGSKFLRAFADKIEILPLGLDLAPYTDPSAEDRAEAERIKSRHAGPIWLGCGRMNYYKGFLVAIRALTRVPGTLILIGDGPERAGLEAETKRLGLESRVVFPGHVPTTVPYYLAAHAFWFPSNIRGEAFGLVQVEAMASGCPVINAAIPYSGVSWVSRHGETGLTAPIDDPEAFALAANRLLNEPGLRETLAEGARARAVREFDHRVMADRTIDVYRRVLAAEANRHPVRARPAAVVG